MKLIPLSNEQFAKVDDEDFDWINDLTGWHNSGGYAVKRVGKTVRSMHRLIMFAKAHQEIDHANGDKLDNQKSNLRFCTRSQNQHNRKKSSGKSSEFKGVYYNKVDRRWQVQIAGTFIAQFKEEHHAALCYDLWAIDLFGAFARTNFKSIQRSSSLI